MHKGEKSFGYVTKLFLSLKLTDWFADISNKWFKITTCFQPIIAVLHKIFF